MFWLVIALGCLSASLYYHLTLPVVRTAARDVLNEVVSGLIQGRLHVGRFEKLSPRYAVARNVRFYDPHGRLVAHGDKVVLRIAPSALLRGTLRFKYAALYDGEVVLIGTDTALPTLIQGFLPADPTPGEGEPLHAVIERMELHDVTVRGQLIDLKGIRAVDLEAVARLEAKDKLEIEIWDGSTTLVKPFPFRGRVEKISGKISTDPHEGMRLHALGSTGEDRAGVNIAFAVPEGQPPESAGHLDLLVHARPIDALTLQQADFEWAELLYGPLRGYFRLYGPPEHLRLSTHALSAGGQATLEGDIREDGVTLNATTKGVQLSKVIEDWPDMHVAGQAELQIAPATGPDQPPRAIVRLQPFSFAGYAVPSLQIEGLLQEDHFQVLQAETLHAGGRIEAKGTIGFDGQWDVHLRGSVAQIARDPNVRRLAPGARGALRGDVRLVLGGEERPWYFGLQGYTLLRNFRYGPVEADWLKIQGSWKGEIWQPRARVHITGAGVEAFDYPLGKADVRFSGSTGDYVTTGRFRAANDRRVEWDGEVLAEPGPKYTVDAQRLELATGPLVWRGAIEQLIWKPDVSVSANMVRLASGSQRLEAHGVLRFRGPDQLEAQLQDLDMAALEAIFQEKMPPISGHADASFRLKGDLSNPEIALEGALRNSELYGVGPVDGVYVIGYGDGRVILDAQMDLREAGAASALVNGIVDPKIADPIEALSEGVYEVEMFTTELELAELRQALGLQEVEINGRMTGSLRASGPLQAPSFKADLHVPQLIAPGWPVLQSELTTDYKDGVLLGRVSIDDHRGELAEAEASLLIDIVQLATEPTDAVASLETFPWRVSFRVPPRRLGDLPGPVRGNLPREMFPMQVGASATAAGGALQPKADLHAVARWPESEGEPRWCAKRSSPRVLLDARLRQGVTTVLARSFVGRHPAAQLQASASTPVNEWLRASKRPAMPAVSLAMQSQKLPLELVPGLCQYLRGPIDMDLAVDRLFSANPTAELSIRSNALRIAGSPVQNASVVATIQDEQLFAHARLQHGEQERASIEMRADTRWKRNGVLELQPDGPLRMRAYLRKAPFAPVVRWLPAVDDARGDLSGRLLVNGTVRKPEVSGEARLTEGFMKLKGLGQQLTNMRGLLELKGNSAELRQLVAQDGEGRIELTGSMGLDRLALASARLHLESDDFPARREGTVLATLSGRADVDIGFGETTTRAKVDVRELGVRLPEELKRAPQELDDHPDVQVAGQDAPVREKPHTFTVQISAPDPFWVRRNDFAAQVIADLVATYRDPDFRVVGEVEMRRGFFEVFGKTFNVERGVMRFTGDPEVNPEVLLVATHQLRNRPGATVTVVVTGRLGKPDIAFSSTEATNRGEIIGLLMGGGRATRPTPGGTGANEQQAGEEAASFLAGLTAGILTLTARRELGDVIPVIIIESGDRAFQSARLRMGFHADSLIPDFLRDVVRGAYFEGFYSGTSNQVTPQQQWLTGGQARGLGALLELQFPYNILGTGSISSSQSWGLDFTWEP